MLKYNYRGAFLCQNWDFEYNISLSSVSILKLMQDVVNFMAKVSSSSNLSPYAPAAGGPRAGRRRLKLQDRFVVVCIVVVRIKYNLGGMIIRSCACKIIEGSAGLRAYPTVVKSIAHNLMPRFFLIERFVVRLATSRIAIVNSGERSEPF